MRQIRTKHGLNLVKRNRLGAIFEVVSEQQLIVKHIDGIDEGLYNLLLVVRVIHIPILEAANPAYHLFRGVLRLLHLCL